MAVITVWLAYETRKLRKDAELKSTAMLGEYRKFADAAELSAQATGRAITLAETNAEIARESVEAAQRSAAAGEKTNEFAKKSADAAVVSAEAAKQTLKSSLAWVNVSEIRPVDYGQGVFGFHVHIKNFGSSPAHNISLKVHTDFRHPLDEFIKVAFGKTPRIEFSVLQLGEIVAWEMRQPFTDDDQLDIKLGKRSFYVYGTVTYLDVFNTEHTNRFRYLLSLTPPILFLARGYADNPEA